MPVEVPCGQCIGCRLERSRQWAIRCVHESKLYEDNCFITLTYDDEHLPANGTLVLEEFQKFMKRLRKRFSSRTIRFFHCGEYGEQFGRPHYHCALFNFDFPDKKPAEKSPSGEPQWSSAILDELWENKGRCRVGTLTFESAAYVARYITKKVTGPHAAEHYEGRKPEYVTMSRRPGIGKAWYEKFKKEVYPSGFIVLRGVKMKPPKFYFGQFELEKPLVAKAMKLVAKEQAKCNPHNSDDRLSVREKIQLERSKQLKRTLK